MPIVFPNTAGHDGRYYKGTHTRFSESYVIQFIHHVSWLAPDNFESVYREHDNSYTVSVDAVLLPKDVLMTFLVEHYY